MKPRSNAQDRNDHRSSERHGLTSRTNHLVNEQAASETDAEQSNSAKLFFDLAADVLTPQLMTMKRCTWVGTDDPLMLQYHDHEWGVPVHDDHKHFEFLVLEGAQAGLSWSIVLKKRGGYRRAFSEFDPERVARYTDKRIQRLMLDSTIIRNRMKIEAAVRNARLFVAIQEEFGSFDAYCWRFVGGRPKLNR